MVIKNEHEWWNSIINNIYYKFWLKPTGVKNFAKILEGLKLFN